MTDNEPKSLPFRCTTPLWLQDYFVQTGADARTRNGTATFVHRKGHKYLVTCRHVVEAVKDPEMVLGAKFPTLAIRAGCAILNFSNHTADGLVSSVKASDELPVDIAIAPIDGYWSLLEKQIAISAIDLDAWIEPNWEETELCVACGYPDAHKTVITTGDQEKVASPFARAVAEVCSSFFSSVETFALSSRLALPHGFGLSGMSGGIVYATNKKNGEMVEDEELLPIGIVYQGHPASRDGKGGREGYLDEHDIFVRAALLTPSTFDVWLSCLALA